MYVIVRESGAACQEERVHLSWQCILSRSFISFLPMADTVHHCIGAARRCLIASSRTSATGRRPTNPFAWHLTLVQTQLDAIVGT